MRFSIIIPTCNRPEQLRAALHLAGAQAGEGCEIIVSDDGHGPRARQIAETYPAVRFLEGPRRGPAANRNHGARHALGDWLIFLDDDCLPAPGWLAAYQRLSLAGCDVMEGRTVCPAGDAFIFQDIVENPEGGCYWSCNLAVRREVFHSLNGFDEAFTSACAEDLEFAWRLRQARCKCLFAPEAEAIHPARRLSLAGILRRTAAHRWILLYRLKTGVSPALGTSRVQCIAALILREWLDSLRILSHLRRPAATRRPRRSLLEALWRWYSLPIFLPYYIYWEFRFRIEKQSTTAHCAA